jgi:hypothetical protein
VVATSGSLWGGVVQIYSDDFSSPTAGDWDAYDPLFSTMTVTGGKMIFDAPGYGYPGTSVKLVGDAVMAPIENVEVTCVVHMGSPDTNLYIGPVIRSNVTEYDRNVFPPVLKGTGYGYMLSGYGDGTGEAGLYVWKGLDDAPHLGDIIDLDDSLGFTDADVYIKFSAVTTATGDVQLDGMMSLSPLFTNPFGVISYLHAADDPNVMVGTGQVGLAGVSQNGSVTTSGTFDDLTVSKIAGPGDANGDDVVNDEDASILGANWQVQLGATWAMGDFNEDGKVNDQDAAIMAAYWTMPGEGGANPSVPEPGTLVLLASAAAALWFRRRR